MIRVEAADVEAAGGHRPCVHRGVLHHIVGEVAGGVFSATVLDGMADEVEIRFPVYIEWRDSPMALRVFGLLLHVEHPHVVVDDDDARALELLY